MDAEYKPSICTKHSTQELTFVCQETECVEKYLCPQCILTHSPGHLFVSAKYYWENLMKKHNFLSNTTLLTSEGNPPQNNPMFYHHHNSKREEEEKTRRSKLLEGCKAAERAVEEWKEGLKGKILEMIDNQAVKVMEIIEVRMKKLNGDKCESEIEERLNDITLNLNPEFPEVDSTKFRGTERADREHFGANREEVKILEFKGEVGERESPNRKSENPKIASTEEMRKKNEKIEKELKSIAQSAMIEMAQSINKWEIQLLHNLSKHMLNQQKCKLSAIRVKPMHNHPKAERMEESLSTIKRIKAQGEKMLLRNIRREQAVSEEPLNCSSGNPTTPSSASPVKRRSGSKSTDLSPWKRCRELSMRQKESRRVGGEGMRISIPDDIEIEIPSGPSSTKSIIRIRRGDVEERVYTEGNMGMGMGNIETPTEGMGMGMYPSYPLFEEKRDYGEMRERVRKYRTHGNRAKSVDLNIQIPDDLEVHVPKSSSMMMLDAPYLPVTPKPLIGNSNQRPLRMLANLTAQYNFTIKQIFRNRKSLTFSKSGDHWETLCLNPALPDHFRITAKVTKIDAFDGMIFFGIIAGNQLDFNATFKSKVPWDKGQCAYT